MGAKRHALIGNLAQIAEAIHLKPAAIGQNRAIPHHKLVQAAELAHQLMPRTQVEMIGVA